MGLINELNVFMFGKYKGKTVKYVLNVDPKYLEWCVDNVDWFKPSKELLKKMYIAISKE